MTSIESWHQAVQATWLHLPTQTLIKHLKKTPRTKQKTTTAKKAKKKKKEKHTKKQHAHEKSKQN